MQPVFHPAEFIQVLVIGTVFLAGDLLTGLEKLL